MTLWGIVIIASLACLALKTIGCLVCKTALDKPPTSRVANLFTGALFAALIGVQTFGQGQHLEFDARVPALLVAAPYSSLCVCRSFWW